MPLKPLEKVLDVAVQKLARGKRCHYCRTNQNICFHHLIRRSDKLKRWHLPNLLPVCFKCHDKVHRGLLKEPKTNFERDDIKSYLLRNSLTYDEFLKIKLKEFGI